MRRHSLRLLKRAAVQEVRGDAGCTEAMAADRRVDADGPARWRIIRQAGAFDVGVVMAFCRSSSSDMTLSFRRVGQVSWRTPIRGLRR